MLWNFLKDLAMPEHQDISPVVTIIGVHGDQAKRLELAVRDYCRRQWKDHKDDTNVYSVEDVRWAWWEDERGIIHGWKKAEIVKPSGLVIDHDGQCGVEIYEESRVINWECEECRI